jgi:hypothetical protein
MTAYAGQTTNGGITPLESELAAGINPELFFTEHDRRQAHFYLTQDIPVMDLELYQRLRAIAETPLDHQANYYLDRLHDKARQQGQDVIANISNEQ